MVKHGRVQQNRQWRQRNPEKLAAHKIVTHEIRMGRLTAQPCEVCGSEKSQAHHEDYSKPLDVVWLCAKCHSQRHVMSNPEKEALLIKAEALRETGLSYEKIGKLIGVSRGTAYKWLNKPPYW